MKSVVLSLMVLAMCSVSRATVIWSDNFDYAAGQTLQNNGWVMASANAAYVRDPYPSNWLNYGGLGNSAYGGTMLGAGKDGSQGMVQLQGGFGGYYSNLNMGMAHSFAEQTVGTLSVDLMASHNSSVNPARFFMYDSADRLVGYVNFAAEWGVYLNSAGAGAFNANQWYHVEVAWNAATDTLYLGVNGVGNDGGYDVTSSFSDSAATGVAKIMMFHNTPAIAGQDVVASYDNVVVTPEPATMAILGLGALGLIRRK